MTLTDIDRSGVATRLAGEAQVALVQGDTDRARERFGAAGKKLEESISGHRRPSDKHFVRFLAATQYYKGGHYEKALQLCRKIQESLLPESTRPLFPPFDRDVRDRASADYPARIQRSIYEHLKGEKYTDILRCLQDHPYVLERALMASVRAICCQALKDYRAAALFWADAIKFRPNAPGLLFDSVALPSEILSRAGNLAEAEEYLNHLLAQAPHSFTHILVSTLRFHQATRASDPYDRAEKVADQLKHYEEAWTKFQDLPTEVQCDRDSIGWLALATQEAALTLSRLGRSREAIEICDRALKLAPEFAPLYTIRGTVLHLATEASRETVFHPIAPEALTAFRDAYRLGDRSSILLHYLALDALSRADYSAAEEFCNQGLRATRNENAANWFREALAVIRGQASAPNRLKDLEHAYRPEDEYLQLQETYLDKIVRKNGRLEEQLHALAS